MSLNKKYFKVLEEYHTKENVKENKVLIFVIIIIAVLVFAVVSYLIIFKYQNIYNLIVNLSSKFSKINNFASMMYKLI
jgi:capsular polysaccharide biosynthesis protein